MPADGPAAQAARRLCGGLNQLVAASCFSAPAADFDWSAFPSSYLARVKADVSALTPAVVALALRVWGRMHGQVTLEIHGHLGSVSNDPAALYRAEMLDLVRSLTTSPA